MRVVVIAAVCAACSTSPTLTIGVATEPLAFEFKPDGGDWQVATLVSKSELLAIYEIPQASGTIAIACTQADGSVQVEELLATASDLQAELYGPILPWPQLACTTTTALMHAQVVGSMSEAGRVYIGDQAFDVSEGAQFAGNVTQGAHDVVAFDDDLATVFIDHGVTIDHATTLETINLANGISTAVIDLPSNLAFQLVETQVVTANRTTLTLGGTAVYIPTEELATNDSELIHIVASQLEGIDVLQQAYAIPDEQTQGLALAFLAPPAGAAFSATEVAVDLGNVALPTSPITLRLQYASATRSLAVAATSDWLDEHDNATTFAFDASFPEFSWPVSSDSQHELTIEQRGTTIDLQSTFSDEP